jgi:cell division protein FtsL
MTDETNYAREFCERSEAHARRTVQAMRHAIKESRKEIARYEKMIARSLADLNEAKRVIYERGWSED